METSLDTQGNLDAEQGEKRRRERKIDEEKKRMEQRKNRQTERDIERKKEGCHGCLTLLCDVLTAPDSFFNSAVKLSFCALSSFTCSSLSFNRFSRPGTLWKTGDGKMKVKRTGEKGQREEKRGE